MSEFLVTGGAGFIGSHLVEELVKKGHSVRIVDNLLTGKRENIEPFQDHVEFIEGDIRDFDLCRRAAKGIEYVLHQAALPSVPRSLEDPILTNSINISGTLNLLIAARDAGVDRFVFASSSSVYGDEPGLPKKEGKEGDPLSPYALSKMTGEKYCGIFFKEFGFPTVCLRYFNIFGPRQDPFSQYAAVVPLFITRTLEHKGIVIYGDGEQSRDFTFVGNVVEANILACKASIAAGGIFNIACGERTTVNHLSEEIGNILKTDVRPKYEEVRPGDIRHSFADISLAQKMLNYEPLILLEEGLRRTIDWYTERT
ncbi:MAG: SDR family oxidoreductase [Candidatus Aminicenantes bacterium]|nr:SDR family oxidoreductase [Candidatus Aminicenantes bacterium]